MSLCCDPLLGPHLTTHSLNIIRCPTFRQVTELGGFLPSLYRSQDKAPQGWDWSARNASHCDAVSAGLASCPTKTTGQRTAPVLCMTTILWVAGALGSSDLALRWVRPFCHHYALGIVRCLWKFEAAACRNCRETFATPQSHICCPGADHTCPSRSKEHVQRKLLLSKNPSQIPNELQDDMFANGLHSLQNKRLHTYLKLAAAHWVLQLTSTYWL